MVLNRFNRRKDIVYQSPAQAAGVGLIKVMNEKS